MAVVFTFYSLDPRDRATFVVQTKEQAARHVTETLNDGRFDGPDLWTFDEEGHDIPNQTELLERFSNSQPLKLYDQSSLHNHVVQICDANDF